MCNITSLRVCAKLTLIYMQRIRHGDYVYDGEQSVKVIVKSITHVYDEELTQVWDKRIEHLKRPAVNVVITYVIRCVAKLSALPARRKRACKTQGYWTKVNQILSDLDGHRRY